MITFNKGKSIGKVVFIVEGENKEQTLLKQIFVNALGYSFTQVKKGKEPMDCYTSNTDNVSRIFVITSKNSNIKSIEKDKDYVNNVFLTLFNDYKLDIHNASVYYIFDRDPKSNKSENIYPLVQRLNNSKDNALELGGLLLISYPSIESFVVSCFEEKSCQVEIKPITGIKKYTGDHYFQDRIMPNEIIHSSQEMIESMNVTTNEAFDVKYLDEFSSYNYRIITEEDKKFNKDKYYILLSCLACAFFDLGILSIE